MSCYRYQAASRKGSAFDAPGQKAFQRQSAAGWDMVVLEFRILADHLFICLSTYLSICLSVYLSIYLAS